MSQTTVSSQPEERQGSMPALANAGGPAAVGPAGDARPPRAPSAMAPGPGEAVHRDLWKRQPDPAAARAETRRQARGLGLAFFALLSLVLPGISFSLNGLWSGGPVALVASENALLGPSWFTTPELVLSDGRRVPASLVDWALSPADDPPPSATRGLTPVRIVESSRREGRRDWAWAWAPLGPRDRVTEVVLTGKQGTEDPSPGVKRGQARAPCLHAWRHARLARVVPTRCAVYLGAAMGLLALLAPGALVPLHRVWMRFVAAPLGWFNTRLLLGLVYFLLFTPMALWFRLRRLVAPETDDLRLARREGTYWIERRAQRSHRHYERQF